MFKKLWKDPVGSNVIAGIILGIGAFLVAFIYGILTDKPIKDSVLYLWHLDITLGPTLVVVFLLLIVVNIFINLFKYRPTKMERLKELFHNKFNKRIDEENKITYRFNTYIDEYTNYPFISDLRIYCNNHELESLIRKDSGCSRIGCHHSRKGYDDSLIIQELETFLLNEWEKMKSSRGE